MRILRLDDVPRRRVEAHETRSVGGLTALVVEGDVDLGAPGHHVDPGDV